MDSDGNIILSKQPDLSVNELHSAQWKTQDGMNIFLYDPAAMNSKGIY